MTDIANLTASLWWLYNVDFNYKNWCLQRWLLHSWLHNVNLNDQDIISVLTCGLRSVGFVTTQGWCLWCDRRLIGKCWTWNFPNSWTETRSGLPRNVKRAPYVRDPRVLDQPPQLEVCCLALLADPRWKFYPVPYFRNHLVPFQPNLPMLQRDARKSCILELLARLAMANKIGLRFRDKEPRPVVLIMWL